MNDPVTLLNAVDETPAEQLPQNYLRLQPITLEQLAALPPRQMLVQGLLGVGEMSVWFAVGNACVLHLVCKDDPLGIAAGMLRVILGIWVGVAPHLAWMA